MADITTSASSLTLYDVKMKPPVEETCCAVNPWKARLALNLKKVPYTTTWVTQPDIARVRKELGVPAVRKFADGSDYYTLPILEDRTNNALIGDSFDIAIYLQKNFPSHGIRDLFPEQKFDFTYTLPSELLVPLSEVSSTPYPSYKEFNQNVDAVFSAHVQLALVGLPYDPESADASKAQFVERASAYGVTSWDDFSLTPEARKSTMESFQTALAPLSELFRKTSGPFLMGDTITYGDVIVGAWLQMMSRTLPEEEWLQLKAWHSGTFGRLFDALQAYNQVV